MKPSPIQEITSSNQKISYGMQIWKLCLLSLLFGGIMASFLAVWGETLKTVNEAYTVFGAAVSALGGILCCIVAQTIGKKYRGLKIFYIIPWVVLVLLTTPVSIALGGSAWINAWIAGWNRMHAGGIAMFSYSANVDNIRSFTFCMALFTAQLLWRVVMYNQMWAVYSLGLFWVLVPLLGGYFQPVYCGIMLAGTLGLAMTRERKGLWRTRTVWTLLITFSLVFGAALVPDGDWQAVQEFRKNVEAQIRIFRYGEKSFPEGNLYQAGALQAGGEEMLQVQSEQSKSFYLKKYTGGVYADGVFEAMPDRAYGGEYAGMLKWLSQQGFDPFTQVAQYYGLGDAENAPMENTLQVHVTGAERSVLYVPASLCGISNAGSREKKDLWIAAGGIRGDRDYVLREVSGSRPAELTVTAQWVSDPQNEEQKTYCDAEAVYREFVYNSYTAIDSDMYDLMQKWFWEDYTSDSDGIYSAVAQIRKKLASGTTYVTQPAEIPAGEDPIRYFLTRSRQGNSMMYAAAAVEALRAHGIPARYAEGYYIPEQALADSENGTVSVLGEDAHAWVEIYFDGIGWLPVDVTPGYYYDAVKLQQMVATPDMVHKTLAEDNHRMDAEQITDMGGDTGPESAQVQKIIRDLSTFRLGLFAAAVLLTVLLTVVAESARVLFLWKENHAYDRKSSEEHAVDMESKLLYFLKIRGIEAYLGWNTDGVEEMLMERNPEILAGEYRRVCELLQKTIYGKIPMEPYEERTVNFFLRKLYRPEPGSSLIFKLKLRYGIIGYELDRIKSQRRRKKSEKNAIHPAE